jgi:hypothetical protein
MPGVVGQYEIAEETVARYLAGDHYEERAVIQ